MSESLRRINVRRESRWLSVLVGSVILLVSLRPRGAWGILSALVGSELVNRGLTGRSYVYTVLEIRRQPEQSSPVAASERPLGDHAEVAPSEDPVQLASEQSFPASDPPSFTGTSL